MLEDKKAALTQLRRRRPGLDHLIRAFGRYQADGGDRLAASVTFFGFLSFFPLLALSFSVLGFVLHGNPGLIEDVGREVENFFPGLVGGENGISIDNVADSRKAAGLLGLAGLLFAGLGWIDALREAIRTVWHQNVQAGNFLKKKVVDVVVLAGLGATLLASIGVSTGAGAAANLLLEAVGLEDHAGARVLVGVLGIALAVLTDVVVVLYLFIRLPKVQTPWRRVLKGALFAAVGFEILKFVGQFYIVRTTSNPVYGTVAIAVGLLVWINLVVRFLLFTAAWTVTAPFDSDVAPSGTSSPEQARQAGIPTDYADDDPDDPPVMQDKGAPTPLMNAIRGYTPPQHEPDGGEAGPAPVAPPTAAQPQGAREPIPGERVTRTAATVGAGAVVAGMVGVGVYTARTVRDLVRR